MYMFDFGIAYSGFAGLMFFVNTSYSVFARKLKLKL